MLKTLLGLCQAALLAGMTGVAPYAAGQCALGAAPMPGMAMHGGMAVTGQVGGPGVPVSGRAPAPRHQHHGCCGCLGPCSGCGTIALPAAAVVALVTPVVMRAPAAAPYSRPAPAARRLLPFANGPPSLLG